MRKIYWAITLVLSWCSPKELDWYKNKFVAIPKIDRIMISKYHNPFSKGCIFIADRDTIEDFIVCEFERSEIKKVDSLFKINLEYKPAGYELTSEDSSHIFGNYASSGIFKVLTNTKESKKIIIGSHIIDNGLNVIAIVARVLKSPPSEDWLQEERKWKASWRVL